MNFMDASVSLRPWLCSSLTGGVSLSKSGVVPIGRGYPVQKTGSNTEYINPSEVNLHLLPTNPQANDQYMVHTTARPEKAGKSLGSRCSGVLSGPVHSAEWPRPCAFTFSLTLMWENVHPNPTHQLLPLHGEKNSCLVAFAIFIYVGSAWAGTRWDSSKFRI